MLLTCATTTRAWAGYLAVFAFGVEAFLWGTTSMTVRQRLVPHHLLGRVGSVYLIGVYLGLVVGGSTGGLLARVGGITAPFWFGVVGDLVLLTFMWRPLHQIAAASDAVSESG